MAFPPVEVGSRVLSVEMHGCMAHREENQVWGKVVGIQFKPIIGSGSFPYHVCRIDFGYHGLWEVVAEEIENCAQGCVNPDERRGFVWRH